MKNIEILKQNKLIENIEIYDYDSVSKINKNETYITITHKYELYNNEIFQQLIEQSKNYSEYKIDNNTYETQIIL